ncbi:Nek2 [Drosophila busckii]|uniref:non-specific serine/threonine protein kinase n=2 Tax=Drosophila busckii TaxID=30019 RepID=A0A0M4EV75_DROBS|nr:Nek2 [Drosophila busckii]
MGNGAFGTCYKVRDKSTGQLYAWKGMNYDELDEAKCESLISEISVLRQLQHPNIVQYYHHLINREAKSIYIVMECCAGGDLAQLIQRARRQHQRFEESYIWRVLFQLCRALQVCHNKITAGTILHRDIKPANIFLDASGNVKLGDFGLARLLRRDQSFAASFVGTPHYMSPELVKGGQYDRKSDVWALGCLVYELCALRPPFRGRVFQQLSDNIAQGEFSSIPSVYGSDLQSIIGFMLAVSHEQRPGIEIINRHPLLVRNISQLDGEFPRLIAATEEFYVAGVSQLFPEPTTPGHCSTICSEQRSISGVFTPDLRSELFYSTRRRLQRQRSDPALYESIRREQQSPRRLTEHIFNDALQQRLHAIRAQESLLQQRADELQVAEQRVKALERQLLQKLQQAEQAQAPRPCQCRVPPLPARKPQSRHDDTYCSIELNETAPTVAKLNLAALPAPKQLHHNINSQTLRKVTFQSPPPKPAAVPMQISVSSNESADSQASNTRRKSILSLFGLSRAPKAVNKTSVAAAPQQQQQPQKQTERRIPLAIKQPSQQLQPSQSLTNMWTKEQKRAAFDMLAAMNAAEKDAASVAPARRQQLRQSVRERNSSLQRSRMRRSLVLVPPQQKLSREQMLI